MNTKKAIFLTVASAFLLSGCAGSGAKLTAYDAQYLDYFDTITSITICAESEEQFAEYKHLAEDTMEKYHELFDIYDNYDGVNNVKTINDNAGIAPVEVDKELIDLLELSREEYEQGQRGDGKRAVYLAYIPGGGPCRPGPGKDPGYAGA